ncbi:hypothetical protein LCGC14_2420360, partial [marine sediment metagenome]
MKNSLKMLAVVIVMLVGVVDVEALEPIDDPDQMVDTSYVQTIQMAVGDHLMERSDSNDVVVDKGDGQYYILLGKIMSGRIVFGAYIETANDFSDYLPGYEGWCNGFRDRNTFLEDDSPNYVLAIYDPDGGQFAARDSNGVLYLDNNVLTWETGYQFIPNSGTIEYNGVVDGLLDLVFNDGSGTFEIGHIVLLPPPPPPDGDLNDDGIVDIIDLNLVLIDWGKTGSLT